MQRKSRAKLPVVWRGYALGDCGCSVINGSDRCTMGTGHGELWVYCEQAGAAINMQTFPFAGYTHQVLSRITGCPCAAQTELRLPDTPHAGADCCGQGRQTELYPTLPGGVLLTCVTDSGLSGLDPSGPRVPCSLCGQGLRATL